MIMMVRLSEAENKQEPAPPISGIDAGSDVYEGKHVRIFPR